MIDISNRLIIQICFPFALRQPKVKRWQTYLQIKKLLIARQIYYLLQKLFIPDSHIIDYPDNHTANLGGGGGEFEPY